MKKTVLLFLSLFLINYSHAADENPDNYINGLPHMMFESKILDPEVIERFDRSILFEFIKPTTKKTIVLAGSLIKRGCEITGMGLLALSVYFANTFDPDTVCPQDFNESLF